MANNEFSSVISFIVERFVNSETFTAKDLLEKSGLNDNTVHDVIQAVSLVGSSMATLDVQAVDFVEFAPSELLNEDDQPIVLKIAESFTDRGHKLKEARKLSELSGAVLPDYVGVSVGVELRAAFDDDGKLERYVPIAVAKIDTDEDGKDLLLQFSQSSLSNFIQNLEEAKSNLDSLNRMKLVDGRAD